MNTIGTLSPNHYLVEEFYANSTLKWKLVSASSGLSVTELEDLPQLDNELLGAVTVTRATYDPLYFAKTINTTTGLPEAPTNIETGVSEHLLYKSIRQMFYSRNPMLSLTNSSYVVSIGQLFYGERVKPGSFKLGVSSSTTVILDDGLGKLYTSQSGTGYYVGDIFYGHGIAVVSHNTSSAVSYIGSLGIAVASGSEVRVQYDTDVKIQRHQISVVLKPTQFNMSLLNPSIYQSTLYLTSSLTQSLLDLNIQPSSSNAWKYSKLMQSGLVKPYITTVGLYNDSYELLAIAKLSTPIQRTFDTDQIFIVRFDT